MLEPLKAGEPIRESWIRQLVEAVNRGLRITAAPPLLVQRDAAGVRISMPEPHRKRWAKLKEKLGKDSPAEADLLTYKASSEEWVEESSQTIKIVLGPLGIGGGSEGQIVPVYFDTAVGQWVLDANGQVGKFVATADWNANNIIQARQLVWNGSTMQQGADIEIRDYMGLGGKQGMNGAYFTEDGELWHLATPCPPTETVTQTTTFA